METMGHAGIQPWPVDISMQHPLTRTMLSYPPPATTWLLTYSWTGHGAAMPWIGYLNNHATAGPPCLSQGKWNSMNNSSWASPPTTANDSLSDIHRLPALAKTIMWTPPDTTPILLEPSSHQRQWEHMRAFHSSTLLWPSKEWKSQTQMEGGLPLIWTMLHPPSAEAKLLTYAWTGLLENYLPWRIGQTGVTIRPPTVSYARWNIRKSTLPQARVNPSHGPTHTNQDILEKSISGPSLDLQQYSQEAQNSMSIV